MARMTKLLFCLVPLLLLAACSGGSEHRDLLDYMEQQNKQPGGEIEPLPTAQPYKTARYDAQILRSPFEEPILLLADRRVAGKKAVEPDDNRVREYLESISFSSFTLVGSISQGDQMWSLLNDGSGIVHRVTVGNYIGKNHGRITSISRDKLDVIEIVSDGKGGWLEKPRTLSLEVKE